MMVYEGLQECVTMISMNMLNLQFSINMINQLSKRACYKEDELMRMAF